MTGEVTRGSIQTWRQEKTPKLNLVLLLRRAAPRHLCPKDENAQPWFDEMRWVGLEP